MHQKSECSRRHFSEDKGSDCSGYSTKTILKILDGDNTWWRQYLMETILNEDNTQDTWWWHPILPGGDTKEPINSPELAVEKMKEVTGFEKHITDTAAPKSQIMLVVHVSFPFGWGWQESCICDMWDWDWGRLEPSAKPGLGSLARIGGREGGMTNTNTNTHTNTNTSKTH